MRREIELLKIKNKSLKSEVHACKKSKECKLVAPKLQPIVQPVQVKTQPVEIQQVESTEISRLKEELNRVYLLLQQKQSQQTGQTEADEQSEDQINLKLSG